MGHPLAIARFWRGANAPTIDRGEVHSKARIPFAHAFSLLTGQISHIFHGGTKTSRADHRAVGTGQATLCNMLPTRMLQIAREQGFVSTISGRRRYLKDINSANQVVRGAAERNAVNAPIQGSAADIIKIAMINIHRKLKSENWKSKMLLQVHDELVFDVHKDELERIQPMIRYEMENAFELAVPLEVDMGTGENWLEAH